MGTRVSTHRRRATQILSPVATEARATMEEQVQATKRAAVAAEVVEAIPLRVTIRAQATQSRAPPTMRADMAMAIIITLRVRVATAMAMAMDKASLQEMREATMAARATTPHLTTKEAEEAITTPTHTTISE